MGTRRRRSGPAADEINPSQQCRNQCGRFRIGNGEVTVFAWQRNRSVTLNVSNALELKTEMTPVKAALLSFLMLSGIAVWGVGIYTADAASGVVVVDGYGVGATKP